MYNTQNYISESVNDNYNNVNFFCPPNREDGGQGGRGGNYGTWPVGIGEQLERGERQQGYSRVGKATVGDDSKNSLGCPHVSD